MIDHNPNLDPKVLADSIYILQFVSGSIFIFSFAVVYLNSVAGLGETKMTFIIEAVAIMFYLIGCYYFIYLWEWDIKHIWWVEYIYFGSLGLFSFVYLMVRQKGIQSPSV